jgi:hypothetical protein
VKNAKRAEAKIDRKVKKIKRKIKKAAKSKKT